MIQGARNEILQSFAFWVANILSRICSCLLWNIGDVFYQRHSRQSTNIGHGKH
jgi:hypothetical protein